MNKIFNEIELHRNIIKSIVINTKCRTYLELGIAHGDTFQEIAPFAERSIGVDIVDIRKSKIGEFYKMDTDTFFMIFKEKVDVIFIDANHRFESLCKDFENSLKHLDKFGIIIVYNTDPMQKSLVDPRYCDDSYKLIDFIYEKHPELNIVTLPISLPGLSIIMRKNDRRVLEVI